jgi:hypothetical protein
MNDDVHSMTEVRHQQRRHCSQQRTTALRRFASKRELGQGCQMAYFKTKNPNLGIFWRDKEWKNVGKFMSILNILWPFCGYLLCFPPFWYM